MREIYIGASKGKFMQIARGLEELSPRGSDFSVEAEFNNEDILLHFNNEDMEPEDRDTEDMPKSGVIVEIEG